MSEPTSQEESPTPATEESPQEKPWSEEQEMAMKLILAGVKIKETAERLGVDRRTINRWMKHPRFQAGVAERKALLRSDMHDQMEDLLKQAYNSLALAMDDDDYRAAIGLLKATKVLDGTPITECEAGIPADSASSPVPTEASSPRVENTDKTMGQMGHSAEITPQQQQVLAELETGKTLAGIMEELNIDAATLRDWTQNTTLFSAALRENHAQFHSYWELNALILNHLAIVSVRRALKERKGQIALAVLKGLGVLQGNMRTLRKEFAKSN